MCSAWVNKCSDQQRGRKRTQSAQLEKTMTKQIQQEQTRALTKPSSNTSSVRYYFFPSFFAFVFVLCKTAQGTAHPRGRAEQAIQRIVDQGRPSLFPAVASYYISRFETLTFPYAFISHPEHVTYNFTRLHRAHPLCSNLDKIDNK